MKKQKVKIKLNQTLMDVINAKNDSSPTQQAIINFLMEILAKKDKSEIEIEIEIDQDLTN